MRRTHHTLAMLALTLTLVGVTTAAAAAQPTTGVEDHSDRLLRWHQAQQAQAAVALTRSMERNLTPAQTTTAALIHATVPATTTRDVDVLLASLLLGLAGGLVGGGAVIAGWTAVTRRRPQRATATT
jgi:hypothetical protein